MSRPVRLYRLVFTHPSSPAIELHRAGQTPCAAKNAAFKALEDIIALDGRPPTGWRLQVQQDVTHTLPIHPDAKPFPRR